MQYAYPSTRELPPDVRDNLPEHAQDIYREAFNAAWEQGERTFGLPGEESLARASEAAWAAVAQDYIADGRSGRWRLR